MKELIVAASLCVCSGLLLGCGPSTETARVENNRPTQSRSAQNARTTAQASPPQNTGPAQVNSNAAAESPIAAVRNKKLDAMRRGSDPGVPKMDIEAILKQSTRPAPEDSEFAVALTDIVVERRTFSRHPVLSRVEKVTDGERKSIHVVVNDGRIFDLPGDSISALSTVPSATILTLIKIELPPRQSQTKRAAPAKTNSN